MIDPYLTHLLKALHGKQKVQVRLGSKADVGLPAKSVDLIIMNGVHLGAGLSDGAYKDKTLPWLKSMARALRPGGLMVIEDDSVDLLRQQMVPKVERAGFKNLNLIQGAEHGLRPTQWVAAFRR